MAAQVLALGPLTTVTAGTPVQASTLLPAAPSALDVNHNVHAIIFEAIPSNTAKVYIGTKLMNKGTLAAVAMALPIPTANLIPTFSVSVINAPNGISLDDFWLDSDTSGQGCLVTVLIS